MVEMSALARYKKLHHNEGYSIVRKSEEESNATVVLRKDGNEVEITSSSREFVDAVQNIAQSVRAGNRVLIDLEDAPCKDTSTFLTTQEYFETESEDPAKDAIDRINQGDVSPPTDIDFEEGLEASLKPDIHDENLQKIVRNYVESLGILLSNINKHTQQVEKFRHNNVYNIQKFDSWFSDTLSILHNSISEKTHTEAFKSVCEQRTDIKFISRLWVDEKQANSQFWEAVLRSPPDDVDSDAVVRYRQLERADDTHSDSSAKMPANAAIGSLLDQYASLYELSKDPLHDIAVALGVSNSVNTDSHGEILDFLSENSDQDFTYPIVRQLRHGPSHMSVELNEDEHIVQVYNNKRKNRIVQRKVTFEEVPRYYYSMSDMLLALVNGFIQHSVQVQFAYLQSEEFQYQIMENAKEGVFEEQ